MKLIYVVDNHDYNVLDSIVNELGFEYYKEYVAVDDDKVESFIDRLKNEGFKRITTSKLSTIDIIDTVYTSNADPYLVENDDEAIDILCQIETFGLEEISKEDEEDWDVAVARLDLEGQEVDHIYRAGDYTLCFSEDHDWKPNK